MRPWTTLRDAAFGALGSAVDRAAVDIALGIGRARRAGKPQVPPSDRLRQLARVTEAYSDPRYFTEGDGFFARPAPLRVTERRIRALPDGGGVWDLAAASDFVPVHSHPRDAYLAHRENQVTHARLLAHATPRATVLCVHGYLGGRLDFEETAFGARWLYDRGVDVMLAVLPFHGMRAPAGRSGMFPGDDPWRTIEGFAHAVSDLRGWREWLRARGSARVGLFGMSLGGYTSSLLATVDHGWDFVVPMIPLASLADIYLEHRAGRDDAPPEWVRPRIAAAFEVVSPFARPAKVGADRALVIAARGDRICPITHAERIAAHLGGAPIEVFPGGHLLQLGRTQGFGAFARFLAGRKIIAPR